MKTTDCDEIRDRIAAGAADAEETVEAHLLDCVECRAESSEIRRAATVFRAAHALQATRERRAGVLGTRARGGLGRAKLAAAALLAIAATVALFLLLLRDRRDIPPSPPLAWRGNGVVVRLAANRARYESGAVRFEARASYVVESAVAEFSGDSPAVFEVGEGSVRNGTRPRFQPVLLVVEAGFVRVGGPGAAGRIVGPGETVRFERPPTAEPGEPEPVSTAAATTDRPRSPDRAPERRPGKTPAAPPAAVAADRGSCHGRLEFDDGTPVAQEPVWLWGTPHVVARTDASGAYRIDDEWVGEMPRTLMLGPEDAAVSIGPVTLRRGEDVEASFSATRGITLDVVAVQQGNSHPVPDASIQFDADGAGDVFGKTGPDGRVSFRHAPRAAGELLATAGGFASVRRALDLRDAGDRDSVRVEMTRAQSLTVMIDGWPSGRVADVEVQFTVIGGRTDTKRGRTDRFGRATLECPAPGRYDRVLVRADSFEEVLADVEIPSNAPYSIRIGSAGGASVEGHVVDATGGPLRNAEVMLLATPPAEGPTPPTRRVKLRGRTAFRFDLVKPGRYEVGVLFENGIQISRVTDDVDVSSGGLAGINIRLPSGRVEGRLRGDEPRGSRVVVGSRPGESAKRPLLWIPVKDDGSFSCEFVEPGSLILVAQGNEGSSDTVEVFVSPGGAAARAEIAWRTSPVTSWVLMRPDGAPVTSLVQFVAVRLEDDRSVFVRLEPGADGRVACRALPAGRWRLEAPVRGRFPIADVIEGDNPPIELVIER